MNQHDIVEEDNRKSLQDWWALHAELAERGVDLSRDYILKTVNGMARPELFFVYVKRHLWKKESLKDLKRREHTKLRETDNNWNLIISNY